MTKFLERKSLLRDSEGNISFLIKIEENVDYGMFFQVEEVQSWGANGPLDCELYLSGLIKWDGCSHLHFGGSEGETGKNIPGYLHLCGKFHFEKHCLMMKALYELAEKTIVHYLGG